jgi:MurNAc alpha-1-phosphate uridylyltransferase
MIQSAMILAAGLGRRMRPLTDVCPKPLLPVARKTMLERTFEHVKEMGISNIVVNTHYLASQVEEATKKLYPEALISYEEILLETGGGIRAALPLLKGNSFFTLNGDRIWSDSLSLKSMEAAWNAEQMDALLLLVPREQAHGYEGRGDFFLSEEGRLTRPAQGMMAPYVYIGVQITQHQLFKEAPTTPFSINLLWNKALEKNRLYGTLHQGEWFHISTPDCLKKYEAYISTDSQD